MGELTWMKAGEQYCLMEVYTMKAKIWPSKMYGWCIYCWTAPPAQTHVPTLEEAKALAIALVKLN